MQILVAPLENIILGEKTSFSAEEAIAQTDLSVDNAQGFSVDDYVVLGKIGSETSEIRKISAVASDLLSITVDATKFLHVKGAPIRIIRYNQRKFYRSTTESGTYTHLSSEGSPVNINVDRPEGTEFEDSTGTTSSWYKATYYNSTSLIETSLSDAVAVKAGDTDHYTSIFKIKTEAGFQDNPYIGIELVDRYRIEAEAQAEGAVVSIYQLPFSSKPKLFQHIITLLAAGNLLAKEYGMEADVEVSKTGQRKIERAEELLEKIRKSKIILIDENGNELSKRTDMMASNSNKYSSSIADQGELFNIGDERFNLTDPADPLSSSLRSTKKNAGFK